MVILRNTNGTGLVKIQMEIQGWAALSKEISIMKKYEKGEVDGRKQIIVFVYDRKIPLIVDQLMSDFFEKSK